MVVCEASSYQLHDTLAFAPEAAVLLNLGSDHLDWHGDLRGLPRAKLQVFARQGNDDVAVAPGGPRHRGPRGLRAARAASARTPERRAVACASGSSSGTDEPLLRAEELALPGAHNADNAMATAAVCLARGDGPRRGPRGAADVPGVEHRLEDLGVHDGVRWVNDSKATNVGVDARRAGRHAGCRSA